MWRRKFRFVPPAGARCIVPLPILALCLVGKAFLALSESAKALQPVSRIFPCPDISPGSRRPLMGFPAKVQLIQRKDSQQWYINFPSAVAQAMEFTRGEVAEWIVEDKNRLLLLRRKVSAAALKTAQHGKV